MQNMNIYDAVRAVPDEAQKQIRGGRLNGMTDINPMWRIQTLTEQFGAAGIGWYYEITNKWIEDGSDGEKCAFVDIKLYIKQDNEWSAPIEGTGGSKLVSKEKGGLYTSDEAYKMALTDALSVACKALGMGADIYWAAGRTKYNQKPIQDKPITEKQISNIKGMLSQHPDKGEVLLKALLAKYDISDINELSKARYAEFFDEIIGQTRPVIKKKIEDSVEKFAAKSGTDNDSARGMLESMMGKSLDDILIPEYPVYVKKYKELYNNLGDGNE